MHPCIHAASVDGQTTIHMCLGVHKDPTPQVSLLTPKASLRHHSQSKPSLDACMSTCIFYSYNIFSTLHWGPLLYVSKYPSYTSVGKIIKDLQSHLNL